MTDRPPADHQSWEGEMFRLLADNVRDYAIFVVDADRRVLTWTRGAERLLGYHDHEIVGRSADLFFTPEDVEAGAPRQEVQQALDTGRGEDDRWHVRKDGTRFWSSGVMTPLRDEAGRVRGFAKIMRDRTDLKRSDDARRESEVRTAAVLQTALDAIICIDHAGRVVEFNPAAEAMFGHRRADVLGREVGGLIISPRLGDVHRRGLAQLLATGEGPVLGRRVELLAVRADGTEFPVELAVTRIPAAGPPQFTAYLRDVSDRTRTESHRSARLAVTQTLAEAATIEEAAPSVLRAVCESLGWDVGCFWAVDGEARVLRCLDTWHLPDARVPAFEAASRGRTFRPGEGLPGRVWATGKPAWLPDVIVDVNFPRAPVALGEGLHGAFGCPVRVGADVIGVIEFFSRQIREPDADLLEMMATVAGQVGQFMDRKRAEADLRESEQRFARFMQHLPGLAWLKDLDGRYVFANDAAVKAFRTPRADLYGKTDDEVFPPETAAQFRANDRQAVAGGVQVVEALVQADGVVHSSLVSKFPIPGTDGRPALVGGMAIDITDRMRAETALREADRLKDEFLAMLAHELRNPLAPVRNALHVLKQPGVDAATVGRVRDMAERQVQHMGRLLDDLLDVSRISRGRIELRREAVDVAAVIGRAVEAVRPLIEDRRHELTVALPADQLRATADPTRLEQVLTNLLNNAAKYTDPGGHIRLTAEVADDVVVRVRDTGIGIAPDVLPKVFDLFVQAERRLDRSQGGVGIGLTLVKRLVELHGGRVEAHSDGPGRGSEFVVRLPAAADRPTGSGATAGGPGSPDGLPRRRVLVVDDNRDAADSLAVLLTLAGQEVRAAYDGPTALAVAAEFRPAIMFLDIGMPGMDGYAVAREVRADPAGRGAALVALTGWGQEEDRRRSKEAGFDRHLVKPIEPDLLHALLAEPGLVPQ